MTVITAKVWDQEMEVHLSQADTNTKIYQDSGCERPDKPEALLLCCGNWLHKGHLEINTAGATSPESPWQKPWKFTSLLPHQQNGFLYAVRCRVRDMEYLDHPSRTLFRSLSTQRIRKVYSRAAPVQLLTEIGTVSKGQRKFSRKV